MRRVLSLWQPWATLVVARDPMENRVAKAVETRSWAPKIPLPFAVAIHATAGFNWEQRAVCKQRNFMAALDARGYFAGDPRSKRTTALKKLPLGCIVGVATVAEVLAADDPLLLNAITETEVEFGLYRPGRFAWILTDQVELRDPIPFKGKQSALYELHFLVDEQVEIGLTLARSASVAQNSHATDRHTHTSGGSHGDEGG